MSYIAAIASAYSAWSARETGKEANRIQQQMADEARRTAEMQRELYNRSEAVAKPFRDQLYSSLLETIKSGGTDISKLTDNPMYKTVRSPLEDQYAKARESMGSMQGGGALMRALSQLEIQRAESVGRIPGQIYETARQEGMGLAGLNLQAGAQSLASSGGAYQNLAGMYGGQVNQASQQMGQAGSALGQALYGSYSDYMKKKQIESGSTSNSGSYGSYGSYNSDGQSFFGPQYSGG